MTARKAIEVLEKYIEKADLDRYYDREELQAFDQAFDALEERAEEEE